MADNHEIENKLLRRVLGKLVSAIEIELDAGSIEPTDWEKPIFEEAKLYATRVGVTFQTEAERIGELEADLTRARADNAKLETLWENAVAARDKLSEELTRARAERDAALKGWYEAGVLLLQTDLSHDEKTIENRNQYNEAKFNARAAIKAEGE